MHKLKYIHVGFLLDMTKYVYSKNNKFVPCNYDFKTLDYNELINRRADMPVIYDGSDKTIGLGDIDTYLTGIGFILPNGQFLSSTQLKNHNQHVDAILTQLLVEYNFILKDYYDESRYKYTLKSDYLCQRLGFIKKTRAYTGFHSICYNPKLMTPELVDIIYECIENGMYIREVENDDDLVTTKKLIKRLREELGYGNSFGNNNILRFRL